VLIVATSATDKSRTAKLLADRKDALVAMFWPPDLRSVAESVRRMADAAGIRIDGALAERIARAAGLDTRLAQSEVTKLALYLDASPERPRNGDAAALDAIGARTEDEGFMPLVNVVLSGEANKLSHELHRLRELGLNPVGVLLAFERRAAQLAQLAAKLGPRGNVQSLIEAEKSARRIFFKDERDLRTQLQRWRGPRLARLVDKLADLHRALLANSQSAELLLGQGLAEIARVAARSDKG
jgi:DNA polymerase-3 subunit delta